MKSPNALALEYQREYGTARRYIDITHPRHDPLIKGEGRVFGPGFTEKIDCLVSRQASVRLKDRTDS